MCTVKSEKSVLCVGWQRHNVKDYVLGNRTHTCTVKPEKKILCVG